MIAASINPPNMLYEWLFTCTPALFFVVVAAATALVVTTVLTAPTTVVATLVVPTTVLAGTVEIAVLVTDTVPATNEPPTLVEITCPETMVLETTEPGRVVGWTVVADTVLAERVVV